MGGGRRISELDDFRREEGVLLRGGASLEGVGPCEGWRVMPSSRGRSERDERRFCLTVSGLRRCGGRWTACHADYLCRIRVYARAFVLSGIDHAWGSSCVDRG